MNIGHDENPKMPEYIARIIESAKIYPADKTIWVTEVPFGSFKKTIKHKLPNGDEHSLEAIGTVHECIIIRAPDSKIPLETNLIVPVYSGLCSCGKVVLAGCHSPTDKNKEPITNSNILDQVLQDLERKTAKTIIQALDDAAREGISIQLYPNAIIPPSPQDN